MRGRSVLLAVAVVLLGAASVKAQALPLPPVNELPPPPIDGDAASAPVTAMPGSVPEMPATCPVGCISAPLHRHPLWSWLTYQPARRPWLDGHCIHKAPNIQPPLYDYFPCMGRTCDVPSSPMYNPCVGPYPYQCPLCDGKTLRCGPNGCTPQW